MWSVLQVALTAALALQSVVADHIQPKIRSGEVPCRAVNLGAWLLGEAWMSYATSPMWKDVPKDAMFHGEYLVMKALGVENGTKAFESHWSAWITEKDIQEIANAGLNTVRVPIGYWIINDDPVEYAKASETSKGYARGGLKYLDRLINEWAVKYNLAVMLSLHAHQGSQNGYEHSAPQVFRNATWWKSPENVANSLHFATFIAERYQKSEAFLGLALMNEPGFGCDKKVLEQYYKDAYAAIRATGNDCIIGTAPMITEQGPPDMMDFMPCPKYFNVWHEWHVYLKWGWEGKSMSEVFTFAHNYSNSHFSKWQGNPIFESEWSLATDDKVPLSRNQMVQYAQIQLESLNKAPSGWAFWSWRHDDDTTMLSGWSLVQMLREGIFKIPAATTANLTIQNVNASANVHTADLRTRTEQCKAGEPIWTEWFQNSTDDTVVVVPETNTDNGNSSGSHAAADAIQPPKTTTDKSAGVTLQTVTIASGFAVLLMAWL